MKQFKINEETVVIIRKAKISDAKAILEYINTISKESDFLTFGEGEFNKTIEEEELFIDSISKKNNALFIVAEIEGKIVGTLNFSGGARPRVMHTGEFGVSVLKEYWGQGIGTELIKYLIEWCKNSNVIRKINLRVRSDNYSAIHIYKKLGFIEEGVISRDFQVNNIFYDSIIMGLYID
ncbi:acetyltransferase, GNAT family [Proteiniborus sp. DW1]|uniref:GNAT family N-acetyltransferase n=1 Tax=Proteiniborus sp. DW1 TaxID=1889883 RepID=UPI00092DF811|nr:GNAT family protein [Proteiniborus sp. DW1]SCG82761.1 acetyltransferase, GNAT family [Proteiniborus sp. DW1]